MQKKILAYISLADVIVLIIINDLSKYQKDFGRY